MDIKIETEFITLQQFLKLTNHLDSGGQAKWFLEEHRVLVNGVDEQRRGRKLVSGDKVQIKGKSYTVKAE